MLVTRHYLEGSTKERSEEDQAKEALEETEECELHHYGSIRYPEFWFDEKLRGDQVSVFIRRPGIATVRDGRLVEFHE